jgi:hypothetical protein
MKSTSFYYPAKVFRLFSTIVPNMIRTPSFPADRRVVRAAAALRMQAPE